MEAPSSSDARPFYKHPRRPQTVQSMNHNSTSNDDFFCLWRAVLIQHVGFLEIETILRVSPLWYSLTQQCWNTFVIIELTHGSSVVPLSQLILPRASACSDIPSGVRQRRATRCAPTCSRPPTPTPSVKPAKTSCFTSSIWTASRHLHG